MYTQDVYVIIYDLVAKLIFIVTVLKLIDINSNKAANKLK